MNPRLCLGVQGEQVLTVTGTRAWDGRDAPRRLSGCGTCPAPLPRGVPSPTPSPAGHWGALPPGPSAPLRSRAGKGRRRRLQRGEGPGEGGGSPATAAGALRGSVGMRGRPTSVTPSITTLPITTPSVTNPIIPKSPPPSPPPSPPNPRKGHVKARLRFWGAVSSSAQTLTAKHFQMWSPPGPLRLGRT